MKGITRHIKRIEGVEGWGWGEGEGQARGGLAVGAREQQHDFVPVSTAEISARLGSCNARQVERVVSTGRQQLRRGCGGVEGETRASKRWTAGMALDVRREAT